MKAKEEEPEQGMTAEEEEEMERKAAELTEKVRTCITGTYMHNRYLHA